MNYYSILGGQNTLDTPTFIFSLAIHKDLNSNTRINSNIEPFLSGYSTSYAYFVKYGMEKPDYNEIIDNSQNNTLPGWVNRSPETMTGIKLVEYPDPYAKVSWWNNRFAQYVQRELIKLKCEPFAAWNQKIFLY